MDSIAIKSHPVLVFAEWAMSRGTFSLDEMLQFLEASQTRAHYKLLLELTVVVSQAGLRTLSSHALFGYLQWVELERALQAAAESKSESDKAHRLAMWSLWISIASMLLSVVFSVWQLLKC